MITVAETETPTRRRPHRLLIWLLLGVIVIAGVLHAFGANTGITIIIVAVLALLGLLVLRFLPKLRHHFNDGRRPRTRRERRSRTIRSRQTRQRAIRSTGSGRRAGGRASRSGSRQSGVGGRSRRLGGSSATRRRAGGAAASANHRRPRRSPPSSSSRTARRARRAGGVAAGTATRRRRTGRGTSGRGPGGTRRPGGRKARRPTPTSGRRLTRPSTWRGRNRRPGQPNRRPTGRGQPARPQQNKSRARRLLGGLRHPRRALTARRAAAQRRRAQRGSAPPRRRIVGRITRRANGQIRRGPFGALAARRLRAKARSNPLPNPARRRWSNPLSWFKRGRAYLRRRAGRPTRQQRRQQQGQRLRWRLRRPRWLRRRRKPKPGNAIPVPPPRPLKQPTTNGHHPNRPIPPANFVPPAPTAQPTRGGPMEATSHPVTDAITETAQEKFAGYEPEGPLEWLSFMRGLPTMLDEFGSALGGLGDKLASDYPSPDGVPDMWGDLVASIRGLSDHASDMAQRFEDDPRVQRALNPQPNEQVLDVQNDG